MEHREPVSVARFRGRKHRTRKSEFIMVECPVCDRKFQPKGLWGHLRFVHKLSGDKLDKAYYGNVEKQQKQQVKQARVDQIGELHDRLIQVRARLKEVETLSDDADFLSSDDAAEKLKKLYTEEEERVKTELDELLGQTDVKGKGKDKARAWDEP